MKHNKGGEFSKLILRRKIRSTLSVSGIGGKNKKIQIEVRKKRTYVQCADLRENQENIDLQNDTSSGVMSEKFVTGVDIVQDKLVIDNKEVHQSQDIILSSEHLLHKNSNCSQFTVYQQATVDCQSDYSIEKKLSSQVLSKNDVSISSQQKFVTLIHDTVNSNINSGTCHHVISLEKKDNDRKSENERRHRSRIRTRYKSGSSGKLIKHKRNNNHRLHDFVASMSDDAENREKEQLYELHRVNKHRRKQTSNTLVQSFNKPVQVVTRDIIIGETISVAELASKMSVKGSHVVKVMIKLGLIANINQIIDQETAQLIAEEMGHNVILRRENELEDLIIHDRINSNGNDVVILKNRAPIVTIMGHVDHGKTSLLDYIRATKVAATEAGGITQSIGAYHVTTNNGMITFIDTPGHAAFTAMRMRGAQLTDIVILVVAADDGVMPQTIEAIQHAKSANVPILVAINKIDKLTTNLERIYNELSKYGVISEAWGGDVQFVKVSAISGQGIDDLLDAILLQSEILELKVMHQGMASAVVIDSFIDKGRGPVVVVLVREGMLKRGDVVLCGSEYGRVRAMRDEYGCSVVSVGPSVPVELLGLSGTPAAGEQAIVVRDEKKAREVAFYRQGKFREIKLASQEKIPNLDNVFADMKNVDSIIELSLIIKVNTQSVLEVICNMLTGLSTNNIKINVLSSSIGNITETDVVLAVSSHAMILGFNVKADLSAKRIIAAESLDVRYYSVIYDLLNEVKQVVQDMLTPKYICKVIGLAEVRSVFFSPKYGNIAGCMVIEGMIKRDKKIRIVRNNIVIYNGELGSLRRFKSDVNEVKSGVECGVGIKNYNDISSGDIIEVFDVI